jgi:hypothetical protein
VVQYNAEREGAITVSDVCEALLGERRPPAEMEEDEEEELYQRFVELSNRVSVLVVDW